MPRRCQTVDILITNINDVPIFGDAFQTWSITLLPGGGFFTLGVWLLVFAAWSERRKRRQQTETVAA